MTEPGTATDQRLPQHDVRKMMAMMRSARLPVDAKSLHDYLTGFTGRKIEHRNDLTPAEAADLFAELEEIIANLPPSDPPTVPVHTAMSRVARDIGARGVGKGGVNQDQHYTFRGIDDIVNALSPIFAKHGLLVVPQVQRYEHENRPTRSGGSQLVTTVIVDWDIIGPAGDRVTATTVGLGMDTSDKSANKAMSAAFKYLLGQAFAIPLVGFDEGDLTSPMREGPPPAEDNRAANQPLLDRFAAVAATRQQSPEEFSEKFRRDNGGMTYEDFTGMHPNRLHSVVLDAEQWAARKAAENAQVNDAGGY